MMTHGRLSSYFPPKKPSPHEYYQYPFNSAHADKPESSYNLKRNQEWTLEPSRFNSFPSRAEGEASGDLMLVEEHLRPLIKEELRHSIRNRRIARGLPETVEIEYKKPQPDDVSPEAMLKRERRRERNKVAAAKCRFKKKIVSEKLQEESEQLEGINLRLQKEIQRLQEERENLTALLDMHQPNCTAKGLEDHHQIGGGRYVSHNVNNPTSNIPSVQTEKGQHTGLQEPVSGTPWGSDYNFSSFDSANVSAQSLPHRTVSMSC